MSTAAALSRPNEDGFRYVVTDNELEAAAGETALSYTYQTSDYQRCCNPDIA